MIICDKFVVLNFPKTGSTFVREMIKELYKRRISLNFLQRLTHYSLPYKELMLPNYQSPNPRQRHLIGQHGAYCQIPSAHLHKEILSVIRNPYDLFLANYRARWWTWYLPAPVEELQERFPLFPSITFDEYAQLSEYSISIYNGIKLGPITTQFIRMYFKEPEKVFNTLTDVYTQSKTMFVQDLGSNITFIPQQDLNTSLAAFLCKHGFSEEETSFIKTHPKINTSKQLSDTKETIWTSNTIDYIIKRESFLFHILTQLGMHFTPPDANYPASK